MTAFDSLRHDDQPVAPDRRFADDLRTRLTAALTPTVDLPERSTTMSSPSTTRSESAEPAGATTEATGDGSQLAGITPYLSVHDAAAAIDWYRNTFDATELVRYVGDDGRIGHCQLLIGGSMLMLADEYPDYGSVSPRTVGGTPVKLNLNVDDVDAVWQTALDHGATGHRPPEDQAYGERSCSFADPFGHEWMVQTTIAHPTHEQIEAEMEGFSVVEPDVED